MEDFITEASGVSDKNILFDHLLSEYGQGILQLTYSYVKNNPLAEDLTQDIFIKVYKNLHTFNHQSNIKTWIWRIAVNHCRDYLRSWHHRNILLAYENDVEPITNFQYVEDTVIKKDEDEELIEAILQLPLKFRELLYLYYFEDLPLKEIETLTGIKQNTIKSRLRRARELLKEILQG